MELLAPNLRPFVTEYKTFRDVFLQNLTLASSVNIGVGFITADSLNDIERYISACSISHFTLLIGMHYFTNFTHKEYDAACSLNEYLSNKMIGEVRLVNTFKFHGKLYSFETKDGVITSILGSDNLSSIVDSKSTRVYDISAFFTEQKEAKQINDIIVKLSETCSQNILSLPINKFNENNGVLDGIIDVEKLSMPELSRITTSLTNTKLNLPLKTLEDDAGKSNLNCYLGKGRKNVNSIVIPRDWYEVELITPASIYQNPEFPKKEQNNGCFTVITDDGYKFDCKVSGDNSKNLRSQNDLKILGRWIKGRLENCGALTLGSPVTRAVLQKYGRNTITMTKTRNSNEWYFDFQP